MKKQEECHPLLRELKLTKDTGEYNVPSPLRVLDHLLKSNVLKEEDVRRSVASLLNTPKESKDKNNQQITSGKVETSQNDQSKSGDEIPPPRTRHIALKFIYDGGEFSGLAQNIGQESDNSIEKALFQALNRARLIESRETSKYSRCGRTDRGVSAAGQVVALHLKSAIALDASLDEDGNDIVSEDDLPKNEVEKLTLYSFPRQKKKKGKQQQTEQKRIKKEITEYPYSRILNNLLPPTIRIVGWAPVSSDFSARFSATTRLYRYFFVKRQGMDMSKIQQALDLLTGKHDFRNFCKMDVEKVYNFERLIHNARVCQLADPVYYLQIEGQAFLWHQIRCIAAIVFMIGKGRESPDVINEMLNVTKYPGKPNYSLASEFPLVLHDCGYERLHLGYSVQNLWTISCQLERQWEDSLLAAARARNSIDSLNDRSVLKSNLIDFATSKITGRIKKLRRTGQIMDDGKEVKAELEDFVDSTSSTQSGDESSPPTISWSDALVWLQKHELVPDADGLDTSVHIPLMLRSKGTTYEQKVEALKKSDKRRQKFEENVIKKRKTAEEDAAFYKYKAQQGGTGL